MKTYKILLLLAVGIFILAACQAEPETVEVTRVVTETEKSRPATSARSRWTTDDFPVTDGADMTNSRPVVRSATVTPDSGPARGSSPPRP